MSSQSLLHGIAAAIVLAFIGGCRGAELGTSQDTVAAAIELSTETPDNLELLYAVGGHDAEGELAFGRISGAALDSGGGLWISDTHASHVLKIDRDGTVESVFGRHGKGPGEYLQPEIIGWAGPQLVVVDKEGGRYSLLDLEGEVSSTHRARFWGEDGPLWVTGVGKGGQYMYVPFGGFIPKSEPSVGWMSGNQLDLEVSSTDGVLFSGTMPFAGYWDGERLRADPFLVPVISMQVAHPSHIVAIVGIQGADLYLVNSVTGSVQAFEVADSLGTLSDTDVDSTQARLRRSSRDYRRNWAPIEALDTHRGLRIPAFAWVVASQEGTIWLRRSVDGGKTRARWDEISLTGTHLHAVTFPVTERLLAAGGGRIATVSQGALGAEIVRVYSITKGPPSNE